MAGTDEEELGFIRLGQDELVLVWKQLASDDRFTAALSCKKFHEAGLRYGKKWHESGKKVLTVTRMLATLRTESLRAWAAAIGCPSHYPHWVEIHGLAGAPHYNGRVGRAMGPPSDQGRVQVEVDAGLGELPPRRVSTSPKSLKSLLVKSSNLRALVSLTDDLVHAVFAESGGGGFCSTRWKKVVLPRNHSCFVREQHLNRAMSSGRTNASDPLLYFTFLNDQMGGKTHTQIHLEPGEETSTLLNEYVQHYRTSKAMQAIRLDPSHTPNALEITERDGPLAHAVWAHCERSPLLHKCGEWLTIQRTERPHARERGLMDNQLATYLMIDTESGLAPPSWQSGIGDVYLYRAPVPYSGFNQPVHLTLDEVGFVWDWINGELGSGEDVELATAELYKKRLRKYLERNADGKDFEEYMNGVEDLNAKLASGELKRIDASTDAWPLV